MKDNTENLLHISL